MSAVTQEITIPVLPCHSIDEVLDFYTALGFEIKYKQAKPNTYAVIRRKGIEFHFFALKKLDPKNSYSTCYVIVPDVDSVYNSFLEGLKQKYGSVPTAGIPRLIPLKNKASGVREFIVVDPGGNWIRIGQKISKQAAKENPKSSKGPQSKLSKATQAAEILDRAGQYEEAAEKIDAALVEDQEAPLVHRIQALVFRTGLAINMGNPSLAQDLLSEVREIKLNEEERRALTDELQRADEFGHMLT